MAFLYLQPEDPPFLTVGTEVSAKYKGAFCEAKVHKVVKSVKVKVSNIFCNFILYLVMFILVLFCDIYFAIFIVLIHSLYINFLLFR